MWRDEPDEVKAYYARIAEQGKANHLVKYPGYK
jgi:hypothetical protein